MSQVNKTNINYNCKFFKGTFPCEYNKKFGLICDKCKYFSVFNKRILIIKLSAIGDVLRTTFILPSLKRKYKNSSITWITNHEALPIIKNNKYINNIYTKEYYKNYILPVENYDIAINLDNEYISCSLLYQTKSKNKYGFSLNEEGKIYPVNSNARKWLEMACFDQIKKSNKLFYQDIIAELCEIKEYKRNPLFFFDNEEKIFKNKIKKKYHISKRDIIIGIYPGSGKKWISKRWNIKNYISLVELIIKNTNDLKIFIICGIDEQDLFNEIIKLKSDRIIIPEVIKEIRKLAVYLSLCNLLVTGDTVSLHFANAFSTNTVALIGPTSPAELYLASGKIFRPKDRCECFYESYCKLERHCLDSITPQIIFNNIAKYLKILSR
jgi:heptosyltransferase-2